MIDDHTCGRVADSSYLLTVFHDLRPNTKTVLLPSSDPLADDSFNILTHGSAVVELL